MKKLKPNRKKLILERQTVRHLDSEMLSRLAGGATVVASPTANADCDKNTVRCSMDAC